MERQQKVQQLKRNLHELRDLENEKLYHLVNETYQELTHLSKNELPKVAVENSIDDKYNTAYNRILTIIKKENEFILPYIDKLIDKMNEHKADTFEVYANLTIPLKNHVIEQSKIMDKLGELKNICFSSTINNYCGNTLLSIIEVCQLFEKHIFIFQHLIIPNLIYLVEFKESVIKPQNKNLNHAGV